MNKQINFEDTIFILNVRIRMIRSLLQLDVDCAIFLQQTLSDLEFVNSTLDNLTEKLLANVNFFDREAESDNLSDAEWQLTQLLNEISNNRSPFSPSRYPKIVGNLEKYRKNSEKRQRLVEASCIPAVKAPREPVVSPAELNSLLGIA